VDAAAVLMSRTQEAWKRKAAAGALLVDIKSAFNNVSRSRLCQRLTTLGADPDLVRWTDSFMQDRRIRLEMEGRTGAEHSI